MPRTSNYDKLPFVAVGDASECAADWDAICSELAASRVLCIECYPGVLIQQVERELTLRLPPTAVYRAQDYYRSPAEIEAMLRVYLGNDPVFGRMNGVAVEEYFNSDALENARIVIAASNAHRCVLIVGTGASLLAPEDSTLVYVDLARWEIQLRYRSCKLGNLGLKNEIASPAEKYKCGFFLEWRAADRLKKALFPKIDFMLDTNDASLPKLISGTAFREALSCVVHRPFRVVPRFDPGPWAGHWMEEICDLPKDVPNHAWCFDCVPEENSLLLGFGDYRVEIPSIDLVISHPVELLGDEIKARFGTEFPIRFDLLDTIGGGNLSLQVHPLTEYIQDKLGMNYTQDESYYMLDALPGAAVFLGLKENIGAERMVHDLRSAQFGGPAFPTEQYVNQWPAIRHNHFLIPAGTIHCSGRDCMVLEISATPYIFTFKLWDWGRPGMDGQPRPVHIEEGIANIQWDRLSDWNRLNLIDRVKTIANGEGWREETTGLHPLEFIETRRHWFTGIVPHDTNGGVNVLNLVQGEEAVIESPSGAFAPFVVHYAETFILPAAVGAYTIRPFGKSQNQETTVTRCMKRVERGVGAKLIDRSAHPVRPTKAGTVIVYWGRKALHALTRGLNEIQQASNPDRAILHVGYTSYLDLDVLARIENIGSGSDTGPSQSEHSSSTSEVIACVLARKWDCGFIITPATTEGLVGVPIYREPFGLLIASDHPLARRKTLSIMDLCDTPLILPAKERNTGFRTWFVSRCGAEGVRLKLNKEVGNPLEAWFLASQRVGVALMPKSAARNLPRGSTVFRPFAEDDLYAEIELVFRDEPHSPMLAVFVEEVRRIRDGLRPDRLQRGPMRIPPIPRPSVKPWKQPQ
jgi:DNA-binding transcriptional LysR family regulator